MNVWWTVMVVIGAVNWVAALFLFCRSFRWAKESPEYGGYITILRVCGLVFASVAAYRSVFVSSYPSRLAWFDTVLNSPMIIRSLATFAEMSFIGLIAVVLIRLNKEMGLTKKGVLALSPYVAVLFIFAGQFFAFGGLFWQSNLLFAIEEGLWGAAFLVIAPLVVVGLGKVRKAEGVHKSVKAFFIVMAVWCAGYLAFQWGYAMPFIYIADIAKDAGRVIPTDVLRTALYDIVVTRDFDVWGGIGFFIWHSGYFSVCVWMSLFFMSAPRPRGKSVAR
ncbi:MAG: hypothetical protein FWE90_05120 [Defluviitaleaceae bacterium]|nr:hypothetical protein [Defluviitaleaceae bacterium]